MGAPRVEGGKTLSEKPKKAIFLEGERMQSEEATSSQRKGGPWSLRPNTQKKRRKSYHHKKEGLVQVFSEKGGNRGKSFRGGKWRTVFFCRRKPHPAKVRKGGWGGGGGGWVGGGGGGGLVESDPGGGSQSQEVRKGKRRLPSFFIWEERKR